MKDIQARSDDELVGRVLEDRWVIDELVGRGGMGTVYKGRQRSVDRTVAIKVLRTDLSYKEDSVERFFREANLAANINNANCVTIFDFGQSSDGEILYLAMEFLEGESLLERSRKAPLSYRQLCEVSEQICSALSAFHSEGVIHRDLKPENIFLVDREDATGDEEELLVKVFDFGIAKSVEEKSRSVTQTGDVIGTPPFMSPEQCSGESLDARSDLYALGCILFEQLSGRVPFTGDSAVDLMISHAHRDPPRLEQIQPGVPQPLVELTHDLLEKLPENRPQFADEVRERLQSIRESLPDEVAESTTRGSGSGDTATQRALDSDQSTEALTSEDFETIAELGYVPDDVEPGSLRSDSDARVVPTLAAAALVMLLAGGGWGLYAGWFGSSSDAIQLKGRASAEDQASTTDAGGLAQASSGTGDVSSDLSPGVLETMEALRKAQAHAAKASEEDQGSDADESASSSSETETVETTESSGAKSVNEETSAGVASESDEGAKPASAGPLAKFPLLTGESAAAVFEEHTPAVENCFRKHLGETPKAEGDVELQVVVGADGGVESASIVDGSITSKDVRDCVRQLADDWQFPPTQSGGAVAVRHTYGFKFRWQ